MSETPKIESKTVEYSSGSNVTVGSIQNANTKKVSVFLNGEKQIYSDKITPIFESDDSLRYKVQGEAPSVKSEDGPRPYRYLDSNKDPVAINLGSDEGLTAKDKDKILKNKNYIANYFGEINEFSSYDSNNDAEAKKIAQADSLKFSLKDNILLQKMQLVSKGNISEKDLISLDKNSENYKLLSDEQKQRLDEIRSDVIDKTIKSHVASGVMSKNNLSEAQFRSLLEKGAFFPENGQIFRDENQLTNILENGTMADRALCQKLLASKKPFLGDIEMADGIKVKADFLKNTRNNQDNSYAEITEEEYNDKKSQIQNGLDILKKFKLPQYNFLKEKGTLRYSKTESGSGSESKMGDGFEVVLNNKFNVKKTPETPYKMAAILSHELIHAKDDMTPDIKPNASSVQEEMDANDSGRELMMDALNSGEISLENIKDFLKNSNGISDFEIQGSPGSYKLIFDKEKYRQTIRDLYQKNMNDGVASSNVYDQNRDGIVDEYSEGHGLR